MSDPVYRWEDLQVAALRLTDATEDMNDAIRKCADTLKSIRARPGWVPIPDPVGHALLWNGTVFLYDDGKNYTHLLSSSRERRLIGANALEALFAELKRPR